MRDKDFELMHDRTIPNRWESIEREDGPIVQELIRLALQASSATEAIQQEEA